MNRRIVLVDQIETPNYMAYFGCGLGNEIYTLQSLQNMEEEKLKKVIGVGEGDAVMLVGAEPFKFLKQFYHYGVRNENYFDCAKLRRLSIEGGAFSVLKNLETLFVQFPLILCFTRILTVILRITQQTEQICHSCLIMEI